MTVNGVAVDPVLSIAVAGTQSDEMLLALTAGQTVQIVLSAILNIGLGGSAEVMFERVALTVSPRVAPT